MQEFLETKQPTCYTIVTKGGAVMRKILDKLFEHKKLAFWIPILFATALYLLFLLFGSAEDKRELLLSTPIVTVIWLFGVFLLVFIQVKKCKVS